ncbi:MAG: HAMP domain-containing histidine kinase [Muribaculaceae bacterium]|nr:HAMP domain-containing histidine kinase [Muribaculaceae bacterium]
MFFLSCLTVFSQTVSIDSLKDKLAKATNPADSLIILYNIFDLTHTDESIPLLEEIYELSARQKDYESVNTALALLSSFNTGNDSIQIELIKRASELPPLDINRATLLYLKARQEHVSTKKMSSNEKQQKLLKYLADYRERDWTQADIYEQTESLFMLVNYLSETTNGDMLTKYLLELQELVQKIDNLNVISLFNSIASQTFIDNDMFEAAAQANRDKLSLIEKFDSTPQAQKRPFRSHNGMLFNTYLSLLTCEEVLSDDELDEYYNGMVKIEKENPASRFSKNHLRRAAIYYNIGKQNYARALPLIKEQLNETNPETERRRLLALLIEAAKAENDKATLLVALDEHNAMLKKHIAEKADANYKELQILYDVQNLKQMNANLTHDNQVIAMERQRAIIIAAIIGLILVILILIFLWRSYSRAHRLSKDLSSSNIILTNERDNLKDTQRDLIEARDKAKAADRVKTDFVASLSHEIRTPLNNIIEYSNLISDSVTGETAPYIKRFAEIVSRNSALLNTLANDILDGQSLENPGMGVRMVPTSAKSVCQHALINMDNSLKPGVKLLFTSIDDPDVIFNTDPHRVEQILRNLLDNAIKFTQKGVIKLSYCTDPNRQSVIFSVTDTGAGIPAGKEEDIFERFGKLDPQSTGNGLGLYVARTLARLINSVLTLDTSYHDGARFQLEVPISA